MEYAVVQDPENGNELVLIAASRVAHYEEMLGHDIITLPQKLRGSDLAGQLQYENPFQSHNGPQPVLHADFVSDSSGTGLVHIAPGHGMDDYHVCANLHIPAFAPVDDAGKFTEDAFPAQPEFLKSLPVADTKMTGTRAVIDYLRGKNMLRAKHNYRHKYPIDWRTKRPVIVRATEQWFANVDGIKGGAMKAMESVNFLPETGRARLESFIQGRSQWCISRQRAWGVPIPALYKVTDGNLEAAMDSEAIQHIIEVIKERGIDAWWTDPQDDPAWKPKHFLGTYVRGRDTMDVWFDSGTSWTLLPQKEDRPVADVYLEGTDQHRGWFQSSLLTHVAAQAEEMNNVRAPYKTLITHGFTLDSKERKMSKSLGNVVSPAQIMSGELASPMKKKKKGSKQDESTTPQYDAMGADALRLWAASSDYTRDVTIGQPILLSVNRALRKYRVTFKWLLGVFSLPTCPPPFTSFNALRAELHEESPQLILTADKIAMHRLAQVSQEVSGYYAKYEFYKGVNAVNNYLSNDLSAFYFETLKDRIYTGTKADCHTLQNVLGLIYYELLQMLAPICPLLVEEAWDHLPEALRQDSVHPAQCIWTPLAPVATSQMDNYLDYIRTIGAAINSANEDLRGRGHIGSSLESHVFLALDDGVQHHGLNEFLRQCMQRPRGMDELASLFVVSGFEVGSKTRYKKEKDAVSGVRPNAARHFNIGGQNGRVLVTKSQLGKCPRCWRLAVDKPGEERLCKRCEDVVRDEKL
jgi:isoleucyl-tRNA synthetase